MLNMGYAGFERIFSLDDDSKISIQLKYLIPDMTEIQSNSKGEFIGFKQGKTTLNRAKSVIITNEKEGDNYYGISRHESCIETWESHKGTNTSLNTYQNTMAKVIPILKYPQGKSKKADGQEVDNGQVAVDMAKALSKGGGGFAVMPNKQDPAVLQLMKNNSSVSDASSWQLDKLDLASSQAGDYLSSMNYYDKLYCRGWLVNQRLKPMAIGL